MVVCGFVFWLNVLAYLCFKFTLAGYAGVDIVRWFVDCRCLVCFGWSFCLIVLV